MSSEQYTDVQSLAEHDHRSEERAQRIMSKIDTIHSKGSAMSHEGVSDKVEVINKFEPGHGGEGGMSGLATTAAIAALGNRNEQSSAAFLPAMAAMMGGHRGDWGGGGFAAGALGFVAGALIGNRRGGFLGGGDDCGGGAETRIEDTVFNTAVLSKLATIEAAVPLAAANTENVILAQTNEINNLASQAQLANAAGFAGNRDAIQTLAIGLSQAICGVNQNVSEQGCQTRAAIAASTTAILQKLDQNEIDRLRHERDSFQRQIEVNALRSQVEVNQTVTTTTAANATQSQNQFQIQALLEEVRACRREVAFVHQEARATNNNVIAGNQGAVTTGAQTSTPTNVNTRS